jgi:hypothetical protein
MGYDISLINSKTKKVITDGKYNFTSIYDTTPSSIIQVDPDLFRDGIIKEISKNNHNFEFNVTYNYHELFVECLYDKEGIRSLYNKNVNIIIPILQRAVCDLISKYSEVFYKDIYGADPNKKNEFGQYLTKHKKLSNQTLLKNVDIKDDYWAVTPYNVYKFLNYLLYCMCWVRNIYGEKKCNSYILVGD